MFFETLSLQEGTKVSTIKKHFLNEVLNEKMTRFKLSRELNRLQEDLNMVIELDGYYI